MPQVHGFWRSRGLFPTDIQVTHFKGCKQLGCSFTNFILLALQLMSEASLGRLCRGCPAMQWQSCALCCCMPRCAPGCRFFVVGSVCLQFLCVQLQSSLISSLAVAIFDVLSCAHCQSLTAHFKLPMSNCQCQTVFLALLHSCCVPHEVMLAVAPR
jgi:hypothetical protein